MLYCLTAAHNSTNLIGQIDTKFYNLVSSMTAIESASGLTLIVTGKSKHIELHTLTRSISGQLTSGMEILIYTTTGFID